MARRKVFVFPLNLITDGVGAQLQRMLSVQALSRFLGAHFVFVPITNVDLQLNDTSLRIKNKQSYLHEINLEIGAFFANTQVAKVDTHGNCINVYSIRHIFKGLIFRPFSSSTINLFLNDGYHLTNSFPSTWELVNTDFLNSKRLEISEVLTIHLHLRLSNMTDNSTRTTSAKFYIQTLANIMKSCRELSIPFSIKVFSDYEIDPERNEFLTGLATDESRKHMIDISLLDTEGKISPHVIEKVESLRYELLLLNEEIIFQTNQTPIKDIFLLSECHVLIGSKSSFSFVSGLLKHRVINIFPKSWIVYPQSWLEVDGDSGIFSRRDKFKVKRALRRYQRL